MKRKVTALLAAVLVMAMGSMTVMAAPSPNSSNTTTNSNVNTEVKAEIEVPASEVKSEGTTVTEVSEETVNSAAAAASSQMMDLNGLSSTFASVPALSDAAKILANAATDTSKAASAKLVTVVNLNGATGAQKLTVPGVKKGDIVYLLVQKGSEWEVVPAVATADNTIEAELTEATTNCAIVKVAVTDAAGTQGSGSQAAGGVTSPQTGMAVSAAAMMALVCLAGAAVCVKKLKAN